jgi:hypothetical protein
MSVHLSFFFFLGTSLTPLKFDHFCKYPINVQKFSLTPPKLSIALNLDPSVQIRPQNFEKKDQNTPNFHFFKKILELEILNSEF